MVRICPVFQADMQRNAGIHCECTQEFFRQAQIVFTCTLLGKFRPEERELLDVMVAKAADAVLYTMQHGLTKAGNIFNAVQDV